MTSRARNGEGLPVVRILYGVVGEGMGHATRSHVVLQHLARAGHEIRIVVSGRAHAFLVKRLAGFPNVAIEEIHGLTLSYFGNELDRSQSVYQNLKGAPKALKKNIEVYQRVAESGFAPDVVISDFESWAALYARRHGVPVISIDNMQIINRCQHDKELVRAKGFDFELARLAVKMKVPKAYHYLVTSFFFPPVRKKYTALVPPILRPEVVDLVYEPQSHVLVYQTQSTNQALVPTLKRLPWRFRVYGLGREGSDGNVTLCPFSETKFLDDLRTARAVVCGGGFSLLGEAVSLGIPTLSIPVIGQFEQELNARYLDALGYGAWARRFEGGPIATFLERSDEYRKALGGGLPRGNGMLMACVDELLARIARGEKRPVVLESPAMGKWTPDE
ncbi:MAG TPA: MJ1255/VC2487 family glycosyltransferase [Polyangiaceae bacterium]